MFWNKLFQSKLLFYFAGLSPEEAQAARAKLLSHQEDDYPGCRRVFVAPSPSSASKCDAPVFAVGVNDSALSGREVVKAHCSAAAAAVLPVLRVLHDSFKGGVRSCSYTLVKSVKTANNAIKGPELGPTSHAKTSRYVSV